MANNTTYSVTLSESQNLAVEYEIIDVQFMMDNFLTERARRATDDICQVAYPKYMETGKPLPSTKEEIVIQAYQFGWVEKAADRANIQKTNPVKGKK